MSVDTTHEAYNLALPRWTLTRDAVDAERVRKAKTKHLPELSDHKDNPERYDAYWCRGYYVNVTGRTRDGLVGAVFRQDPIIELPPELEYALEDCDGGGMSLNQKGKAAVGDTLEVGRYGLLADFPTAEEGATAERTANLRATMPSYPAENILNWRYEYIDGVLRLTLVVLKEMDNKPLDEFRSELVDRYRVLRLDERGYTQQVYDENKQAMGEAIAITKPDGSKWDHIPFHFAGSEDNKPDVDRAPLYDIAQINIAQYRNIADREETLHIAGQPTLMMGGTIDAQTFKDMNPNGVQIGARKGHWLGDNGFAVMLQADAVDAHQVAIDKKSEQMVSIGARLITASTGNQTAEAARIAASSEHSVLSTLVGNVSEALEAALEDMAIFMGADVSKVKFDLNRDFWEETADPQLVMAMIQMADRGDIAQTDVRSYVRRTGMIDENRTDEVIDEDVAGQGIG